MWKCDLRRIGLDWTERIPNPTNDEIIAAICGIKRQGYLKLKSYYYPLEGGIGKLIDGYLKHARGKAEIKVMTGYRVKQINPQHKAYQIVCDSPDGGAVTTLEADKIINTMPLPELTKCLMNIPDEVYHANEHLQWLNLNLNYKPVDGSIPQEVFAIFNPDPLTDWHRCCNYQAFGKEFYVEEISVPRNDKAQIQYAYPVYNHNRVKDTKTILDYAETLGIKSVGRLATMQYLNMDAIINQVKEFVKCSQLNSLQ